MKEKEFKSAIKQIIKEEYKKIILEDAKDDMRIRDMVPKSKDNEDKLLKLAQNMAKSITDADKAQRRGDAAIKIIGPGNEVAMAFYNRAIELGHSGESLPTEPNVHTRGESVIFLPTWSAIAIWEHEITGQLSDGAWENTKPYNHWKFWNDLDVKRGSPEVKGGWAPKKGYNLSSLVPIVGDRIIAIGKMGKALGKNIKAEQSYAAEELEEDGKYTNSYIKKLSKSDRDKFKNTVYTKNDMLKDLQYIKKAMSTANGRD
jgi:hypothetical protein